MDSDADRWLGDVLALPGKPGSSADDAACTLIPNKRGTTTRSTTQAHSTRREADRVLLQQPSVKCVPTTQKGKNPCKQAAHLSLTTAQHNRNPCEYIQHERRCPGSYTPQRRTRFIRPRIHDCSIHRLPCQCNRFFAKIPFGQRAGQCGSGTQVGGFAKTGFRNLLFRRQIHQIVAGVNESWQVSGVDCGVAATSDNR